LGTVKEFRQLEILIMALLYGKSVEEQSKAMERLVGSLLLHLV